MSEAVVWGRRRDTTTKKYQGINNEKRRERQSNDEDSKVDMNNEVGAPLLGFGSSEVQVRAD